MSISQNATLFVAIAFLPGQQLAARQVPDFTKDVAPIFTKYCTGCHNDNDREGKLSLESYASLLKGGAKGGVVTPGQAELSRLVRMVSGQVEPKMPPEGEEAPKAAEIEVLKAWIAAGAKGPSGAAADATILVTPQIKLLAPAKLPVSALAMSPDGSILAVARHGEVQTVTLPEREPSDKFSGLRGSINGLAFSRDGNRLVAASGEPGLFGEATILPADGTDSLPLTFRGHKDSLYSAVLSPDGTILATGGYDNTIKLWNAISGKELRTLEGHNGAVFELAFRADGKVLASASGDRTVKLWNVASGERLDTLKESQKELYTLAFSPDGSQLAAAGVDNRIRVWQITPDAKEGTNPLLHSVFAHESPVLRLVWSADGKTLATCGEDRLVKIWNADTLTIRQTLPKQNDWASGLAISSKGDSLAVGRIDGSLELYPLAPAAQASERPLAPLPEVPPPVDYGPQPAVDELPKVAESEPNNAPEAATPLNVPGRVAGTLRVPSATKNSSIQDDGTRSVPATSDADLFRFAAKAGDQWIIETKAARAGSPVDTKLEVLDHAGQPVPRLLLRAVRDSAIEFRGMTSEQRGVRLANWEEMLLNQYVYLSGDVIKLFQQRRGPDADGQFYPENGNRFAFFDTTPRAHALGEPAYIVVPYAIGAELPNNGLPVFTLNYENDDDAQRKLGKDSRLAFVAPADGEYLVRVSDVRGFGGDNFTYELIVRRPQPDFSVALATKDLNINAGSGKPFTIKAERIDNFMGPITVEITGLPPGLSVTSPIVIQEGLYEAFSVVNAAEDAAAPAAEQLAEIKITATAEVYGKSRTKDVNRFASLKVAGKPKVLVYLEPIAGGQRASGESAVGSDGGTPQTRWSPAITIAPGGTITAKLRVERNGFNDRIAFDVANLPHGVIVDDIGLSGVLIPEGQTERTIFLRAEPWVPEQTRTFFATAQVDGIQSSLPLVIEVKR